MTRALLWMAALVLVYALMLASFDPLDLALGAVVAAALLTALRGFVFSGPPVAGKVLFARAAAVPRLVWALLVDITAGTWQVASVVLGLRPLDRPGIVLVPFGDRTPNGVVVTAFTATLAPGEFLVDIDWDRRQLLFHVLDARDPQAVRARFASLYERHQRGVAP